MLRTFVIETPADRLRNEQRFCEGLISSLLDMGSQFDMSNSTQNEKSWALNVPVFWMKVIDATERGRVRKQQQLGRRDVGWLTVIRRTERAPRDQTRMHKLNRSPGRIKEMFR